MAIGTRMNVAGRRRRVFALVIGLSAAALPAAYAATKAPPEPGHVAQQVIVGFKPGTPESTRADVHRRRGGKVLERFDSILADLVFVGNADALAKREEYKQEPPVRAVSLNYLHTEAAVPDDPLFGSSWALNNTGQTGGLADADVDAPEGWELRTTATDVVVADIDTGIDIDHPDLAANVWTNPSPGPACVGSPPYGTPCGDLHGWDTANDDPTVFDPLQRTGDDFGDRHGTHTAGTIGAVGSNGTGIAGVAWNAKIMPVKFLNFGFGTDANAIQSIDYARTHGAKVINASWGGGGFNSLVKDAIDKAGAAGIVFVAAAGNGARSTDVSPFYPASYTSTNIIAVAATDHNDNLASFSNWGPTRVDLAAPGNVVLSTMPRAPAAVVWNGQLVYLAFGLEGLSSAASREAVLDRSVDYMSLNPGQPVLVVDDDEGKSYESYYTAALAALGFPADVVQVATGTAGPTAAQMAGYQATIWLTGDDIDQTFLAQDQTEITSLLGSGGKLFVSGQEIGNDLDITNTARTWYRTTLRAQAVSNNSLKTSITGEPGGPFDGLSLTLNGGDGANNQSSPSKVWPVNGGTSVLGYPPYGNMNGTSMATPHVAGAVALLKSVRPTATVAELQSWIYNSVDQIPSLAGKVVTGGRLNVRRALELAIADTTPPTVTGTTLTSPGGGEAWAGGSQHQITWNAAAITDPYLSSTPIRLDSSGDGGATWSLIADQLPNTGAYDWQVPGLDTAQSLVRLTATDKLGNAATDTSDLEFLIDSTPPSFGSPSSTPNNFTSNGGSSSLTVPVTETNPDSWTLRVTGDGGIVRTITGSGMYSSQVWNGKDDVNAAVPDGVYTWTVEQRDMVGHVATSGAGTLTVDGTPPGLGTPAASPALFSPGSSPGAADTTALSLTVSETDPADWTLTIKNGGGATVRSASGSGAFPGYVWNGHDGLDALVPDGAYSWTVQQRDAAGNSVTSTPGIVTVDSTVPGLGVPQTTPSLFSPSNGPATLSLAVTEAHPDGWTLTIRNGGGSAVRTVTGSGAFSSHAWDGRDGSGNVVSDGTYTWTVQQADGAGNAATSAEGTVRVDSSAPVLGAPSTNPALFSALSGSTVLSVQVTEDDPDGWTLRIRNGSGGIVRTVTGSGAFTSFTWNGRNDGAHIVPDGTYTWTLEQRDAVGNAATSSPGSVAVDSTPPSFGSPSSSPSIFSPAAGGTSSLSAAVTETDPDSWTLTIRTGGGTAIRTVTGPGKFASFSWNGRDDGGTVVANGVYAWTVQQRDRAGNAATSAAANVTVDSSGPGIGGLAATPASFEPAVGGTSVIGFSLSEPATVNVVIADTTGTVRTLAQNASLGTGAHQYTWDGKNGAGTVLGIAHYEAQVTATDATGNVGYAETPVDIIATDATSKGNWVGVFGTRGHILAAWSKNKGVVSDVASLPSSVQSYSLAAGSRLIWAPKSKDVRALTGADDGVRSAGAYSDASEVQVNLDYQTAERGVLSLYLLDWDTTARRETITITDAEGSRSYAITTSFNGGLWLRVPVSGAPGTPVTLRVTKTAGSTAVISGIMFD